MAVLVACCCLIAANEVAQVEGPGEEVHDLQAEPAGLLLGVLLGAALFGKKKEKVIVVQQPVYPAYPAPVAPYPAAVTKYKYKGK